MSNKKQNLRPHKKKLTETSTTRVWKHLLATNPKELVIVSPFRTEYSKQENLKRMKELEMDVKKMGYGFIKCIGYWINPKDPTDKSKELSLMIPNMNWQKGLELGKKYEQYAIIAKRENKLAMIRCNDNICETTFEPIHNKLNIQKAKELVDNFDNVDAYLKSKTDDDIDGATVPIGTKRPIAFKKDRVKRFNRFD